MRVGSLFAGIGGFDLAAQWMGWETIWYSEIDPYASAVMKKNFPTAQNLGDITQIDGKQAPPVDLLCGGFPCQDISLAGKGAGLSGERSGLWSHYARLIEEIKPRYVVIENVSALRSRGLDQVLGEIAALGYDAEWHCIPAAYVGAPHRRDRVWIVAYSVSRVGEGRPRSETDSEGRRGSASQCTNVRREGEPRSDNTGSSGAVVADAKCERELQSKGCLSDKRRRTGNCSPSPRKYTSLELDNSNDPRLEGWIGSILRQRASELFVRTLGPHEPPPAPLADSSTPRLPLGRGPSLAQSREAEPQLERRGSSDEWLQDDSRIRTVEGWWLVEPDVGRVAHGVPSRVDRLKCLGNAIVPQVAFEIFCAIEERERLK